MMLTASAYANPLPPFPRLGRAVSNGESFVLVIQIGIAGDPVLTLCYFVDASMGITVPI